MIKERLLPEYGSFVESEVFHSIPPSERMVSFSQSIGNRNASLSHSNRNASEVYSSKKHPPVSRLSLDAAGRKNTVQPKQTVITHN